MYGQLLKPNIPRIKAFLCSSTFLLIFHFHYFRFSFTEVLFNFFFQIYMLVSLTLFLFSYISGSFFHALTFCLSCGPRLTVLLSEVLRRPNAPGCVCGPWDTHFPGRFVFRGACSSSPRESLTSWANEATLQNSFLFASPRSVSLITGQDQFLYPFFHLQIV